MNNKINYVKEQIGTEKSLESFLRLNKLTPKEEHAIKWAHNEFKKSHMNTLFFDDAYRIIRKVKNISHLTSDTNSSNDRQTAPPLKEYMSQKPTLPKMPKSVMKSVELLYKSLGLMLISVVFDMFVHHTIPVNNSTLITIFVGLTFQLAIISGIKRCKNWVRLIYISLTILWFLFLLLTINEQQKIFAHFNVFDNIIFIVQLYISARVAYLLLLSSSSDWFNAKKIDSDSYEAFTNTVSVGNNLSTLADELKKLAELKEQGILTEEEFLSQKNYLLKQRKIQQ